jgi:N-acetylmuramoyl-L-alanine amidase
MRRVLGLGLRLPLNSGLLLGLGLSLAAGAAAQTQRVVPSAPRPAPTIRRTVIVDAGHGGRDRGMSGRTSSGAKVFEKDIALGVARKVAARLQNAGVNVIMTRDADTLIALSDRGRIANREQGDLFISVHVNAANTKWRNPTAARGFETYFLAEAKTEDERRVAAMENEAAKYEDSSRSSDNDPLSFMLTDMMQNEHLRESSAFAQAIQSSLGSAHPGPSRGVKQAGFMVLNTAFMPAVLVEIGFGTNPSEASWLSSSSGQAQLADAISRATLSYLAQYEKRASGGSTGRQ